MYDITRLDDIERYERFKFIPDEESKDCEHQFEHYFNSKFPFVRYNKRTRYIKQIWCGIYKCVHCGHCILTKTYNPELEGL